MYLEYKNIEKALLHHIEDRLEDKFIKVLVNECANLLTNDVLIILGYLFHNYRKAYSEEVAQREAGVIVMT